VVFIDPSRIASLANYKNFSNHAGRLVGQTAQTRQIPPFPFDDFTRSSGLERVSRARLPEKTLQPFCGKRN
jgi:hypothetical protein